MTSVLSAIPIPGWFDLFDIALVAVFCWFAIRYFRTTRARAALAGLALLGAVYFVARGLELRLTEALLQAFFTVLVLILVVVFQEDLRRVFEQLGSLRRKRRTKLPAQADAIDLVARTAARLAAARTGALLVFPGREPIERHLQGGVLIGGRMSEPLLLSLFDASSPGHDGAIILRDSSIDRFAVHLPLSANHEALGPGGTRHAAALGLAERCDATCVVVSEERGTVSVARNGTLRTLARPEDLAFELRSAFPDESERVRWWEGRVGRDVALALALALLLWIVFVPGSDVSELTVSAPINVTNLPNELTVDKVDPVVVDVTLRGLRRDLVLAQRGGISIQLDAYLTRLGRRTFILTAPDVQKPDALTVIGLAPEKVRLDLRPAPARGRQDATDSGPIP